MATFSGYGNRGVVLVDGTTDVERYVYGYSTYIDFTMFSLDHSRSYTFDYVLYLQHWDGSRWYNISTVHKGYFNRTVTKRWYISNLPSGSYRIRGAFTGRHPDGHSHSGTNRTEAFLYN